MTEFAGITTAALEAELKRRKAADVFTDQFPLMEHMHWNNVITVADAHVQHIIEHGDEMKDASQWFKEAVLKALYGNDVFDKLNKFID